MAVKSVNTLPTKVCDPDFIYKIVSWDQEEVEKYLTKNGIHGCGFALAANSINGEEFLNLNNQALASWGIPIIKRSKIIALLNELGSESSRKVAIVAARVRQKNAISYLEIKQSPTVASPAHRTSFSAKPKIPKKPNLPVIPPKPQHLLRKSVSVKSLTKDETREVEKILVDNVQLPKNAANSEPFYIDPENADIYTEIDDVSITGITNDGSRGSVDNIPDRRPPLAVSTGSHTEESLSDDDGETSVTTTSVTDDTSTNKRRIRKNGPFTNWFNLLEENLTHGDPCGTPPLPPARNQDASRCSSESNLSQSGSESRSSPVPTSRKPSMQSVTSLSSLAESLPSPSYPPPPVPIPLRRITPARRPSPAKRDPSPFFGSQIIPSDPRSRSPSIQPTSPSKSTRSSNISTDSDLANYPWFFDVDRKQAESLLRPLGNGTFLIRPSKHGGANASFTLSLQYDNRVFHVLIRSRPDGKLALGSEKVEENCFYTLHALVQFHYDEAMQLHSGHKLAGTTRLTCWPANIT